MKLPAQNRPRPGIAGSRCSAASGIPGRLRRGSRVFLLDEPTIGVDVGAKDRIYALLRQSAASGTAILMASSDLEELEAVCTRVLVLRDGVVAGDLQGREITADRLFAECAGLHADDALASKEPIHHAP